MAEATLMDCPHCGKAVLSNYQRRNAVRIAQGICLDCGLDTDGLGQRCAICREKKNAARRKTDPRKHAA